MPILVSVLLVVGGIVQVKEGLQCRRRLGARSDVKKFEWDEADIWFLVAALMFGSAICLTFDRSPHVPIVFVAMGVAWGLWGLKRVRTRDGAFVLGFGLFLLAAGGLIILLRAGVID